MTRFLALFGFASAANQAGKPPLFAYILAVPLAYFAAEVMEVLTFFVQWATVGYVSRWGASVAFRTVGILGGVGLLHGLYRLVVHRDDNSWGGFIRKALL